MNHVDQDPAPLTSFSTPALVLDETRLDANISRMAAWARERNLLLRPHGKTHKSLEIARRQIAAGAVGITVATVSEALVFAEGGIDDLFIAYSLWLDRDKSNRLRQVLQHARVRIGIDSKEAAGRLVDLLSMDDRKNLEVLIEIDSGHHRSGVMPTEAGPLARIAVDRGLDVVGVFTFPGHSYAPEGRARAAADEATALDAAAISLRQAGIPVAVVSGGSTPSVEFADPKTLTELRPGVYALGDAQQWELGTMPVSQISLWALATIVSRRPGHLIADSGSKTLSSDRAPFSTGYGRLLDHPRARITALSEHHATITGIDLPIGSRIRIAPNHVCVAVNLADHYITVDRMGATARWPVDARGRNS